MKYVYKECPELGLGKPFGKVCHKVFREIEKRKIPLNDDKKVDQVIDEVLEDIKEGKFKIQ